ncbi:hypothetical protein [Streptomyces sp. CBMA156]|nr:hypothetical protein [Streptomyces sp. CBMA156]
MTTIMVQMTATRTEKDEEEVSFIDDLEDFSADALPGCGDDNPYQ